MKANPRASHRGRVTGGATTLLAQGEPMLWLTGGLLAVCLGMIVALMAFITWQGLITFWPKPMERVVTRDGSVLLGELDSTESFKATPSFLESLDPESRKAAEIEGERLTRRRYQTGRKQVEDSPFRWMEDCQLKTSTLPEWGIVVERWSGGRFYGILKACELDGKVVAATPAEAWEQLQKRLPQVREIRQRREQTQQEAVDPINRRLAGLERRARQWETSKGASSSEAKEAREALEEQQKQASLQLTELRDRIDAERREEQRARLVFETAWGTDANVNIGDIVRAYPPNQLSWTGKLAIYLERWWEFVSANPREGNSEGGVFPALIGTLVMTILMSVAVVPLGVLAAIYLREYAKPGWSVSLIRIAINNLAGVPSIVYGVFGLGFFVYICGGSIDQAFFWSSKYPVFGQGGVLWASLTLALLTLPIVIVATEESLSAVPNSMREGSYACGASQWQTIRHIILPRAMPGVMTGLILAVARGAGEVAPLMLVGVIEYSPQLPIDEEAPFFHPERPFMHLGFSIYYAALKSPNSEASKPMVFTTTLLLIVLIATLNVAAIWLRGKLRRRFQTQAF